jgi:hypothetical protein
MSARRLIATSNASRCGYEQMGRDHHIKTMTGTLLLNGEPVQSYKVERCDKCSKIEKLDKFGYQKSDPAENLIWFCGACR